MSDDFKMKCLILSLSTSVFQDFEITMYYLTENLLLSISLDIKLKMKVDYKILKDKNKLICPFIYNKYLVDYNEQKTGFLYVFCRRH